jgi:lysyl-tRNA synthetase, class I
MFWADKVAQQLKERNLPLEWVDDMKTPSGRIHVGSLLGVVFHDLVFKALKDAGVNTKYTYVFENHDPMDDIPSYLPKEKFEKYLGMPLFKIPSPVEGYKDFAEYYAMEFKDAFNAIGCHPEIIWTKDLYTSGKMNDGIKKALDNAQEVRKIYEEMYKKELPKDWYPFQVYCESCGKVSTTRVYNWDGEFVYYRCPVDSTEWTKGCGHEGKVTPFSDESGIRGKMPWKVEWPAKWQAIGVTVEGAGKDHMSKGGSHDMAIQFCERVFNYPVPYPVGYEFMLIGGKKMSSSKGRGYAASDMVGILPPELVRFLIVKMNPQQQTNFDPAEGDTVPKLFDDYQEYARHYLEKKADEEARIFELSQIDTAKIPPLDIRFSTLAQWVQMPNMQQKIKDEGLEEWAKYARIWVEKFAPDKEKFEVKEKMPQEASSLSQEQREYITKLARVLDTTSTAEEFQVRLYDLAKEMGIPSKDAFSAIYLSLLGKNHGPKAAWLVMSLEKDFVKKRFIDVSHLVSSLRGAEGDEAISHLGQQHATSVARNHNSITPDIFSISKSVGQKYPSITCGIAVIKGVAIKEKDEELEKEKEEFLKSLEALTTEELGQYKEIQSYRRLYKEMGVDWHSRRPSPEALLRRVALKKGLYTVNTCVDAYNLIVMKHRISVGAFDLDKIEFPTQLRFAEKGEGILLLGDTEPTQYKETELAYFDQKGGYNIDFNFRDAQKTAVQLDTKNLYINVDGLYDITPHQVEKVLNESCDIITKYCGGKIVDFGIITAS